MAILTTTQAGLDFIGGTAYIQTGGTTIMSLQTDGKVGIGSTTPSATLDIMKDGGAIIRLHDPGNNSWKLKGDTDFHIYDDSDTDYLKILNSGNVGIGETNPVRKLVLDGLLGTAALEIKKETDRIVYLGTGSSAAGADNATMLLYHDDVIKVNINTVGDSYFNGGEVGIGTTSPSADLHVVGETYFQLDTATSESTTWKNATSGGVIQLGFQVNGPDGMHHRAYMKAKPDGVSYGGQLQFLVREHSTAAQKEVMTLRTSGNVGIGTNNPGQALHVVGKGFFTDDIQLSQTSPRIDYGNSTVGALRFWSTNANAEKMRLDAVGNLGIGVAPETGMVSYIKQLRIGEQSGFQGHGDGVGQDSATWVTTNYKFEASGGNKFINGTTAAPGYAMVYQQQLGNHTFDTSNTTGVAGGAVTLTNQMTILQNGNVGIGSTSPGVRLDVSKSATIGSESTSSTGNIENMLRVKGKNNYSDGTTWYGDYGQILLDANTNMTGSARKFLITNALNNNKFAIIRSNSNLQDPVTDSTASGINSGTADFVILNDGKIGIGTTNPVHKLEVNGTLSVAGTTRTSGFLNTNNYIEKLLQIPTFPNGTANLNVDIRLGNISFWGYIEVEITATYANQSSPGKLTKLYAVGVNPATASAAGIIYANEARVSDALGPIKDNIALGDFRFDGTNDSGRFAIRVSHIVSSGNAYTAKVRVFTHGSNGANGASGVISNLSISSQYTETALTRQYVYYNDDILVGKKENTLATAGAKIGATTGTNITRSSNEVLYLNRTTSFGKTLSIGKDGTTVGEIGTYNGVPYIGYSGGSGGGIMFNGLSIEPTGLGSTRSNATNDIGSTNYKWKSCFLSDKLLANTVITTGAIGIGTTSPGGQLEVNNEGQAEFAGANSSGAGNSHIVLKDEGGTSRTLMSGPSIIFKTPANSDGSNIWATSRLLGSPSSAGSARGTFSIQVRDQYDPFSDGTSWNWRTCLTAINSGFIGIGTNSPSYTLDVTGQVRATVAFIRTSTSGDAWYGNGNSGTYTQTRLYVNQNNTTNNDGNGYFFERGRLANTASAEIRRWVIGARGGQKQMVLDGPGTLTVAGDIIAYGSPSDIRLKENIKPIESALDKAIKLQGVTFDWKESDSILI